MSEDRIALLSKRQELYGYELVDYLVNNENKPIYIVRDYKILAEVRWRGVEDKIEVTSYVVLTEEGTETVKEVGFYIIKTADSYWKNSVRYYTLYGMGPLLDSWGEDE